MKQIYFATQNEGKVISLMKSLSEYDIEVIHVPLVLPELTDELPRGGAEVIQRLLSLEQKPEQLRRIVAGKVRFAYERINEPCIALDSGFYIYSLRGFPGAYVNVALENKFCGIDGILKLVEEKQRHCEFRNCLAYYDGKERVYFESAVKGLLAEASRGEEKKRSWSKLALVFIPEGETKTLAEMTDSEYEQWRTKRRDFFATKFAEWFSRR